MDKVTAAELEELNDMAGNDVASKHALGEYMTASADLEHARELRQPLDQPEDAVEKSRLALYRVLGDKG